MKDKKCLPEFIPNSSAEDNTFELIEMRNSWLEGKLKKEMVENDTIFNKGVNILMVSGPNMGGKSTLLRQTC